MNPEAAKHLDPAFPHIEQSWNVEQQRFDQPAAPGMSLRDYFAAKAMQGICASGPGHQMTDSRIAAEAYALADAMLAERAK